ncbi:MAG: 30S ribosome-binding factor RbfA [Acidobacteriales bacterium]|nr:30S ribosome-binding factor RbfA [Terriglobales bacterium]
MNRGAQHHKQRLAEAVREEIGAIIEGELADPRIGLAHVTEVHLVPDGKSATVLVGVVGNDEEAEATLSALRAATGFIRRQLTQRLGLRQAPEIHFQLDKSEQYESRIDELLKRIKKRG